MLHPSFGVCSGPGLLRGWLLAGGLRWSWKTYLIPGCDNDLVAVVLDKAGRLAKTSRERND